MKKNLAIAFTCPKCGHSFDKLAPQESKGLPKSQAVTIRYETICPACQYPKCKTLHDYPYAKCCACKKPVTIDKAKLLVGEQYRDDDFYKHTLFSHKSCFNDLKERKSLYQDYQSFKRRIYWKVGSFIALGLLLLLFALPPISFILAIPGFILAPKFFNGLVNGNLNYFNSPDNRVILPIKLE